MRAQELILSQGMETVMKHHYDNLYRRALEAQRNAERFAAWQDRYEALTGRRPDGSGASVVRHLLIVQYYPLSAWTSKRRPVAS